MSLSSEELQVTAFRMLDEWPLIRSRINNYSVVYRRSSAQSDESEPNLAVTGMSSGRRVLELINSHRDVKDLIDRSGLGEFETCKALASLLSTGQIVPVTIKAAESNPSRHRQSLIGYTLKRILWNLTLSAGGVLCWVQFGSPVDDFQLDRDMIVWADGYHEAQVFSRIRALESALEIYYTETGQYPSSLEQLIERNLITDDTLKEFAYRDCDMSGLVPTMNSSQETNDRR